MKKVLFICLILCLACGVFARDGKTCDKSKWLKGNTCYACPPYAKCNGKTFQCRKGYEVVGDVCIKTTCPKGQWMNAGKCVNCPINADCRNGKEFKCKKGYTQLDNKCVVGAECPKGKWIENGKCVECPAEAKCDGKNAKCNKKGYKPVGSQCVCSGAAWRKEGKLDCAPCPKNAICDGKGNWRCKKGYTPDIQYQRNGHTQNVPGCVDAAPNMVSGVISSDGRAFACEGHYRWKCASKYVCGCVK